MIRLFNKADYEDIYLLGNLININFEKLYNLENYIDNIYVYETKEQVVAFLMIKEISDEIEILNIAVCTNHRNKQIGFKLCKEVLNKKNKECYLEVAVDNIAAIHLYKKLNFKILNTRKNYYKNNIDAYTMKRGI